MREKEWVVQLRVGIFVALLLTLFVAFVLTIGSRSRLFEEQYTLRTSFTAVEGLGVGAGVRLAGVTVGSVRALRFAPDLSDKRIHLTLAVDRRVHDRVRADSIATIGTIGLVGDKVLEITVGSPGAPVLPDGGTLASIDPPTYATLLRKGDLILDNIESISQSISEVLGAPGTSAARGDIAAILRSLRTTATEIEKGKGLLHQVIYDPSSVSLLTDLSESARSLKQITREVDGTRVGEAVERLTRALATLEEITAAVKTGDGLLHALLYDPAGRDLLLHIQKSAASLEDFVGRAEKGQGLLAALLADPGGGQVLADLKQITGDLRHVASRLARGEGTLGALIEDPTLYEDLASLLRGANRSAVLRNLIRSTRQDGEKSSQP